MWSFLAPGQLGCFSMQAQASSASLATNSACSEFLHEQLQTTPRGCQHGADVSLRAIHVYCFRQQIVEYRWPTCGMGAIRGHKCWWCTSTRVLEKEVMWSSIMACYCSFLFSAALLLAKDTPASGYKENFICTVVVWIGVVILHSVLAQMIDYHSSRNTCGSLSHPCIFFKSPCSLEIPLYKGRLSWAGVSGPNSSRDLHGWLGIWTQAFWVLDTSSHTFYFLRYVVLYLFPTMNSMAHTTFFRIDRWGSCVVRETHSTGLVPKAAVHLPSASVWVVLLASFPFWLQPSFM